jgi:quercetin dioxygenase-like cupin family protein
MRHLVLLLVIGTITTGAALATPPSKLSSQLLSRGSLAADIKLDVPTRKVVTVTKRVKIRGNWRTRRVRETRIVDTSLVVCSVSSPCDVAVVRATLDAGGFTGWHSHPLPSIVVVKAGELIMRAPDANGRCMEHRYGPGQTFIHPAGPHTFVNNGSAQLEFFVTYFAPPSAALLIDAPQPAECP